MCKLCNTDRPEHSAKIFSPSIKEFIETVQDYLNEIPCTNCIRTYSCNKNSRDYSNLDKYILTKLYMSHRDFRSHTLRDNKRTIETVLPGIQVVKTYNSVSFKTYVFKRNTKVHLGTTKSLKEALSMKIQYCIDNNIPKALTILQRKLNEIN